MNIDVAVDNGVAQLGSRIGETDRPVEAAALNAGIGASGRSAGDTELVQG